MQYLVSHIVSYVCLAVVPTIHRIFIVLIHHAV